MRSSRSGAVAMATRGRETNGTFLSLRRAEMTRPVAPDLPMRAFQLMWGLSFCQALLSLASYLTMCT